MTHIHRKYWQVFAGIVLLVFLGFLGRLYVQVIDKHAAQDLLRRRHAAMVEQFDEIRQGKIDCLVNPAPDFLEELLADEACKTNLKTVYLGNDVSDARLVKLRELPNLKSVIFFWTEKPEIFLKLIRGLDSIQELTFDRSILSREGIELIGSLPQLKSLCLPLYNLRPNDLEALKNIPTLENLVLTRAPRDNKFIPILKSLPHLKKLQINAIETDGESKDFDALLKNALPNCQCRVRSVDG